MSQHLGGVFGLILFSLWIRPNFALAKEGKPCFEAHGTETSKGSEESALQDLEEHYRAWLTEDVVYIIAPEERCAFLHLETSEERAQFVEQFWLRRSNSESPDNDFKDEHYRRILFANEKFSTEIPGWNTDRGYIYVVFGPPDRIESHPSGEPTGRPPEEGPGTVQFSWERWHYRYLEGVGADVDLDLVDPSGSGNYRLALDTEERAALFSPPSGLVFDHRGLVEVNKLRSGQSAEGTTASREEPQITIYVGPAHFPQVRFKDLEAVVTSGIVRDQVYFSHEVQYLKATHASTVVRIVFDIPGEELSTNKSAEKSTAKYEIFARVSKPSGWVVDTIERSGEVEEKPEGSNQDLNRKAFLALDPGVYKLAIVVKDVNSGRVGVRYAPLSVPTYEELDKDKN